MKTTELIAKLEAHLATHPEQRNPRESDMLMGYAMLRLKDARDIIREAHMPSEYIPPGAVNTKQDAAIREFLAWPCPRLRLRP